MVWGLPKVDGQPNVTVITQCMALSMRHLLSIHNLKHCSRTTLTLSMGYPKRVYQKWLKNYGPPFGVLTWSLLKQGPKENFVVACPKSHAGLVRNEISDVRPLHEAFQIFDHCMQFACFCFSAAY